MMTNPLTRLRGSDGSMHRMDAWSDRKRILMFVHAPSDADVRRARGRAARLSNDYTPKGYKIIVICDAPDDVFYHHAPAGDGHHLWLHDPNHRARDMFFASLSDTDDPRPGEDCTIFIDESQTITQMMGHQGPPMHFERHGDR